MTDLEGAEALAEFDITESDQMVKVLRTQVDVVLPEGTAVLNAADPRVAGLAPLCDGDVILYCADPQAEALTTHQSAAARRCWCARTAWCWPTAAANPSCPASAA